MSQKHEISCWKCHEMTSLETRNEFDGCCWACGEEIDLDDYLIKAMDKRDEHYAALSAVTAERDRLREQVQRMIDQTTPLEPVPGDPMWSRRIQLDDVVTERDQLRAEVERWKTHASNWESVAHKQDRRLKDILRGLASDKALSVFQAPCDIELLPVPCEVIHDDDVLLVIHQRAAAMAAKEAEPEHVCSGCGAKGWTGNCLACIPY